MISGVDLNNRYVQAGIVAGVATAVAGATYLASSSKVQEAEDDHCHDCCGCSSISSMAEEIETSPIEVKEKKTLLTSFASLAKSVVLLPVVLFVSAVKAILSVFSSIYASAFSKSKV